VHLINCLALTFVPPWIVYKSKLTEFATAPQVVQACMVYTGTQLLQMILTATFVPSSEAFQFDFSQEFMKAFISFADVLGLYHQFQTKRTSLMLAVVIGLAWATMESVFRRLVPLVNEARSMQFSWKHTLTAVEANISLSTHIAFAVLVWLWIRREKMRRNITIIITLQRFAFPVVTSYLRYSAFVHMPIVSVVAEAVMSAATGIVAWTLASQSAQSENR